MSLNNTEWKVFKYGVSSGPYYPVFSPNTGKYVAEKSVSGHFSQSANNYRCK